jgi:excisionase family DNA binding protein
MTAHDQVVKMRKKGLTLSEIGRKFGITAERVRQIVSGRSSKKERPAAAETPLSTGDVARLLNVHTNTVRRWSASGILKTFRVGPRGDRRFKKKDVQKLFRKS